MQGAIKKIVLSLSSYGAPTPLSLFGAGVAFLFLIVYMVGFGPFSHFGVVPFAIVSITLSKCFSYRYRVIQRNPQAFRFPAVFYLILTGLVEAGSIIYYVICLLNVFHVWE